MHGLKCDKLFKRSAVVSSRSDGAIAWHASGDQVSKTQAEGC